MAASITVLQNYFVI